VRRGWLSAAGPTSAGLTSAAGPTSAGLTSAAGPTSAGRRARQARRGPRGGRGRRAQRGRRPLTPDPLFLLFPPEQPPGGGCGTLSETEGNLKTKTALLLTAIAALTLTAQQKPAILHPELEVKVGTWSKPAATIGAKPSQPWTETTIAAGVNKQPRPGTPITRVGEIVDLSCYVQLGKHGEAHRSCGQKCVQNGQPIGLLTRDGTLYMIMPEEHDPRRDGGVDAKAFGTEHMGHIVEVNGTEASVNGYRAIYVHGLNK
jgi:hypothetical protein